MGSLGVHHGRNENGVPGPFLVDPIQGGVVLRNDEHLLVVLQPRNADQPVVEKGQVGLAHGTDDQRPVLADEGSCLVEGVAPPLGESRPGTGEEAPWHIRPGEKDAEDHHQGQEDQ